MSPFANKGHPRKKSPPDTPEAAKSTTTGTDLDKSVETSIRLKNSGCRHGKNAESLQNWPATPMPRGGTNVGNSICGEAGGAGGAGGVKKLEPAKVNETSVVPGRQENARLFVSSASPFPSIPQPMLLLLLLLSIERKPDGNTGTPSEPPVAETYGRWQNRLAVDRFPMSMGDVGAAGLLIAGTGEEASVSVEFGEGGSP